MRLLRRLWARLFGPSVAALALLRVHERIDRMNEQLSADIAAVKADVQTIRDLVAKQASDLAAANAALAAAIAAQAQPSEDLAAAMKALEDVHASLQSIAAPPAAPPAAPEPAPADAPAPEAPADAPTAS